MITTHARPLRCALLLLLLLTGGAPGAEGAEPRVTRFTPEGTAKQVRQVSAVFSEAMVAFGDPRAADPFDVECPEAGSARWVDTAQWVYDFARDLPAGIRCTFTLRSGARALAGGALGGPATFTFSTGGPSIRSAIPRDGSEWIDEEQAFVLLLDAVPTPASLRQHVGFAVEGIAQRVGFRDVTGVARERILATRFSEPPRGPVLVIQPVQRFPNKARVTLVWGAGVAAASGVATDEAQPLQFKVRDPFTVTFGCERESKNAGCLPITPMRLRFSAPVATDLARRVVLRGPQGRQWTAEVENPALPSVDGLSFKGPFPEKGQFTMELPAGLKDDAGRVAVNAGRFPLPVKTEPFPPLAKFPARFGIIEAGADPALPVTLRNVEPSVLAQMVAVGGAPRGLGEWVRGRILRVPPDRAAEILPWLRRVGAADRERSVFAGVEPARQLPQEFDLPKPHGVEPMEVVGIPLKAPGFYVVELRSARLGASLLGKAKPMYVPAAALVTNLGVHFKWGRSGSLNLVGEEALVQHLRGLGFDGLTEAGDYYGPSLALGSADVSLWELVNAYRTLANGGMSGPLRMTIDEPPGASRRVSSESAAFLVSSILADRESRSPTFGLENPLATRFWTAVKTGTSVEMRDNWCVGYSRRYTVGVWVGNFSGEPMRNVSGVTGAAPVWTEVMTWLHRALPSVAPSPPADVRPARVAFPSAVEPARAEWFLAGTEPSAPAPAVVGGPPWIIAPVSGTIIAHDPDIPPAQQRLVFEAQGAGALLYWVLDGGVIGDGRDLVVWRPTPGRHTLALVDEHGHALDQVRFEVRGAPVTARSVERGR